MQQKTTGIHKLFIYSQGKITNINHSIKVALVQHFESENLS